MLNRNRSRSSVTPAIVRCVSRTSVVGSSPSRSTASSTAANTRPSQECTPGR